MAVGDALQMPRGELPSLSTLFSPEHVSPAVLGIAGDLLWVVAYALIIARGFRDRTYGIPLLAVSLNFTWELVYTTIHPPESTVTLGLHLAWLAIDAVIVYQIFRFGRAEQRIAEIRKAFPWIVVGALVLSFTGQVTFHEFTTGLALFPDRDGITMAFVINFIMSALFVLLFFDRPGQRGLSYPAAWAKMLGTALISLGNVIVVLGGTAKDFAVQFRPEGAKEWLDLGTRGGSTVHPAFSFFLFGGIFAFDLIYVVLLHRARRRGGLGAPPASSPSRAARA